MLALSLYLPPAAAAASPTSATASSEVDSSHTAAKAIDGNAGTSWVSSESGGGGAESGTWIEVHFPSACVSQVIATDRGGSYGGNLNYHWDTGAQSGDADVAPGGTESITLGGFAISQIRLTYTSNVADAAGWTEITYNTTTCVGGGGPDPTATPRPRSTPPPTAAPGPSGSFALTPECVHGYKSTGTDATHGAYIDCQWWTYDHSTTDGDGVEITEGGPWTADVGSLGCSLGELGPIGGHLVCIIDGSALNHWAAGVDREPKVPPGMHSVRVYAGFGPGGTDSGTLGLVIHYLAGGVEMHRELTTVTVASGAGYAEYGFGPIAIPDGIDSVAMSIGCVSGTICGNTSGTNRVDELGLTWYAGDGTANTPIDEDECRVVKVPESTVNGQCGPFQQVFDPNTGLPLCGPLSHDCDKPFLAPVFVPQCSAPSDALNAVGWLSYIGCLVEGLFSHIVNVAIMALNVVIDLLWPGSIDDVVDYIVETFNTRAIFAWIAPTVDAFNTAWTAGSVASPFGEVSFAGQDIDLSDPLGDAMSHLAPWRGLMLASIALAIGWRTYNRAVAALNGGAVETKA